MEYTPKNVYLNLMKMMGYRGYVVTEEALDSHTLVQRLNQHEYVTIEGKRSAADPRGESTLLCVLIVPESKYSAKSPDFKKLLKILSKKHPGVNLMFVSEILFTTHIRKTILQHKKDNSTVTIEYYDYDIFKLECPKHEIVPEHTIPTEQELDQFCKLQYKERSSFPKILESDPQAVWLGLKAGMCVKVKRVSDTAGFSYAYRYCIKG